MPGDLLLYTQKSSIPGKAAAIWTLNILQMAAALPGMELFWVYNSKSPGIWPTTPRDQEK
jgi:hypothetical protein